MSEIETNPTKDQKIIDKEAESIASKAIRLGDITVKEIMIPKVDMVTIQVKDDTNEIIKRIIESGLIQLFF